MQAFECLCMLALACTGMDEELWKHGIQCAMIKISYELTNYTNHNVGFKEHHCKASPIWKLFLICVENLQ